MIGRKGFNCKCCDIIQRLNEMWALLHGVVRSIRIGGADYRPDNDGRVVLPDIVTGDIGFLDHGDYWEIIAADSSSVRILDRDGYYEIEAM